MIELDSTAIALVAGGEEPPPPSFQDQAEEWFEQERWNDIIDNFIDDIISRLFI